jgi:16S rRNA (uracil1498-N3)-methyltransferase
VSADDSVGERALVDRADLAVRRSAAAHVFVTAAQLDADAPMVLDDEVEHHLDRVLRLRDGELVTVTDGAGRWRATRLARVSGGPRLEPDGHVVATERRATLTIASAMPKGDRLDVLVQKTTELGVDALVLLHCARSVVRWKPDRVDRQRSRLQRIADEACRQSRRVWRVTIDGPVESLSLLPGAAVAEPGGRAVAPGDDVLAIGPEGGWAAAELDAAGDRIDLGENVLRTETAAIAAVVLATAVRGAVPR